MNINKLKHELDQAGIPYDWVSDGSPVCLSKPVGEIVFLPEATDEQKAQAEAIKAAHTPEWHVDGRKALYAEKTIEEQLDMQYWDRKNGTRLYF